ncbi:hypothetical protein FOZ62_001321 [Perkinsus olseni]|uniref:Uncharacterized protein n=1 Tax=Perkinsus olseni TaxID=32597 RepID=A0A7J6SS27_PEROL|nr:hypothetical protein FOZ62_001321 [Perkinsus olseni]
MRALIVLAVGLGRSVCTGRAAYAWGKVKSLLGYMWAGEATPQAQLEQAGNVEDCYLKYTCPLGSPNENADLGGIVAHANARVHREDLSMVEYSLDYIYFWDSSKHNNTLTRMNIIVDLPNIIRRARLVAGSTTCNAEMLMWATMGLSDLQSEKRHTADKYLRDKGLVAPKPASLIKHISKMEQRMHESRHGVLLPDSEDAEHAAVWLWGYIYHETVELEKGKRLYRCPEIVADVGNRRVGITLAAKGSGQLKFHEIEVVGSRVWEEGDMNVKHVELLHDIEERARKVEGANSREACEKQLFEYGKEVYNRNNRNKDASNLALENAARRRFQLSASVGMIYEALMGADLS